jgi:hypothetical protein
MHMPPVPYLAPVLLLYTAFSPLSVLTRFDTKLYTDIVALPARIKNVGGGNAT